MVAPVVVAAVVPRVARAARPWLLTVTAGVLAVATLGFLAVPDSSRGAGVLVLASASETGEPACAGPVSPPGEGARSVVAAAAQAGFRGTLLQVAVAVAMAESGHDPLATNVNTDRFRSVDYGLWQINGYYHPEKLAAGDWRDPFDNAVMARKVFDEAGGWSPWVTFNEGLHLPHMAAAAAAVAGGGAAFAPPPCEPVAQLGTGQLGLPVVGRRSSPFGWRTHPVYGTRKLHGGLDIAQGCGTPVVAADAGMVEQASFQGSYGNVVVIGHGDLKTAYAHLSGFKVRSGAVAKGATIGYIGTTGTSTGCHLHFEVRVGSERVDPAPYLDS